MYYKNSKENKNYKSDKSMRQEADNTNIRKPEIEEPVERTVNGVKWQNLDFKTQLANRGNRVNGVPQEQGLEIVSPEFDILTGIRSLINLPKGFLHGSGKLKIRADRYYRQINRVDKGIERAKNVGIIDTKPTTIPDTPVRGISLRKKTFEVPFFSKGNLWYGKNNKYDVIVGKDTPGLDWMPITQKGGFRPDVKDIEEAYIRTTPLVNGKSNVAPSNKFKYYRHYPLIGNRDVTNGFPTPPITGLNTISKIYEDKL